MYTIITLIIIILWALYGSVVSMCTTAHQNSDSSKLLFVTVVYISTATTCACMCLQLMHVVDL